MSKEYHFDAVLQQNDTLDAAYILFPYDLRKETGHGRLHVHALFDNVPYEGSIVNMGLRNADGTICYLIGVPKAIRKQLGKTFGDTVHVTITC